MTDLKKLEKIIVKYLKDSSKDNFEHEYLIIAEKLLFKYKTKPKNNTELISRLYRNFPLNILNFHDEYYSSLSKVVIESIDMYESDQYEQINNLMRKNKFNIKYVNYNVKQDIIRNTLNINLKSKNKPSRESIDKDVYKVLSKRYKNAIKLIKTSIYNAPPINKNIYVYRGEYNTYPLFKEPKRSHYNHEKICHSIKQINLKENQIYSTNSFNSFTFAPWVAAAFNDTKLCCIYRLKITPQTKSLIMPFRNRTENDERDEYELLLPPADFKVTKEHKILSDLSPDIFIKVYDLEFVKAS